LDCYVDQSFAHGPDARVRLNPRAPILSVAGPGMVLAVFPAGLHGEGLGDHHLAFAKDLTAAAQGYADQIADWVGDPQAGADFWASIDTCPAGCGGAH